MSMGLTLAQQFIGQLSGLSASVAGEALEALHQMVMPKVEDHKLQIAQLDAQYAPQLDQLKGQISAIIAQIQAYEDQKNALATQLEQIENQYNATKESLEAHNRF